MELTADQLKQKIQEGESMVIDYFASWCGPCKVLKPIYESVSKEDTNTNYYTFNIDNDIEFVKTLGIRGVPTIKAYKSGSEVFSKSGVLQREELLNVGKMVM
jgi:thioredoxin 1